MAEPRDRLIRPQEIAAVFARRRSNILGILQDEPESEPSPSRSPLGITTMGTVRAGHAGDGSRTQRAGPQRGILGTPRNGTGRGRYVHRSPVTAGRENVPPVGSAPRGRGRVTITNSVLPSWYPRTPLRDITAVVRAIETRRARFGEVEGQEIESLGPQGRRFLISSPSSSGAQLEHPISTVTPSPHGGKKSCHSVGKLPKILRGITNEADSGSESLTPQKKLLNSIDSVEKVVMEELQRLKRTPSAKRAERDKRVRTLMSMR